MVDLLDQIETMLKQEASSYATVDYLASGYQQKLAKAKEEDVLSVASPLQKHMDELMKSSGTTSGCGESTSSSSGSCNGITEMWREKICEWCYQVVDHFDFTREVVSIAMNYLDRYLAIRTVNKRVFQLSAMASLSLAVKLHGASTIATTTSLGESTSVTTTTTVPTKLCMSSMIALSRGYFTARQMEAMEVSIMCALGWYLHPPTSFAFTKHLLYLLPVPTLPSEVRSDIMELARFLCELSVIDYFFVHHRPSHIAVAAIANAMQDLTNVPQQCQTDFMVLLCTVNINVTDPAIPECCHRLRLLYAQGGYNNANAVANSLMLSTSHEQPSPDMDHHRPDPTPSPVCVSFGTATYQPEPAYFGGDMKDDDEP